MNEQQADEKFFICKRELLEGKTQVRRRITVEEDGGLEMCVEFRKMVNNSDL
jgi:hypothetical protein